MENGVCKSVIVTNNQNETYTINAKNTIVATSDFVPIFEKYGFKLNQMGKMSFFANIIVPPVT